MSSNSAGNAGNTAGNPQSPNNADTIPVYKTYSPEELAAMPEKELYPEINETFEKRKENLDAILKIKSPNQREDLRRDLRSICSTLKHLMTLREEYRSREEKSLEIWRKRIYEPNPKDFVWASPCALLNFEIRIKKEELGILWHKRDLKIYSSMLEYMEADPSLTYLVTFEKESPGDKWLATCAGDGRLLFRKTSI